MPSVPPDKNIVKTLEGELRHKINKRIAQANEDLKTLPEVLAFLDKHPDVESLIVLMQKAGLSF